MTIRSVLHALAISAMLTAALSAQSISLSNQSNAAISPSGVVGDVYFVSITGAASGVLVQMNYTQNGTPGVWYAGYTDGMGAWSNTSPPKDTTFIGNWTEQWYVGGTSVGPSYTFEIFDKPTSLSIISATASNPNTCGSNYTPPGGISYSTLTYGPSASIKYQVKGSTGGNETVPNTGLGISMEPTESIGGGAFGDIGCTVGCNAGWLWTPPSAKFAASDGTFYDVPQCECSNAPFGPVNRSAQTIQIKIGNNSYTVKAGIVFAASSNSPGHGSLVGSGVNYNQ
jgi:hypothetical protein